MKKKPKLVRYWIMREFLYYPKPHTHQTKVIHQPDIEESQEWSEEELK